MKIKNLIILVSCLTYQISSLTISPGTSLNNFNYTGASVLPVTSWPNSSIKYVLLSEEADGKSKDTFDDFGGGREAHENHPLITAARETWEESVNLLMNSEKELREYIDLESGNTDHIIVYINKAMVTYITNFNCKDLEKLAKDFYVKLAEATDKHLKEKSRLAWVKYDDLKRAIQNSSRDSQGNLITPVKVQALIIKPGDIITSQEPAKTPDLINLRQSFVNKLHGLCNNTTYVQGTDSKIKFF